VISDVFAPGGLLERALPGYESRPQQLEMARTVMEAIEQSAPAAIEAGTGTGKTLAYLVPAILSGRKVIVSTGTKTLQEQIYWKDIPLLKSVLPVPFTAAYMKGISNYLCLRRWKEAEGLPAWLQAWAERTQTGDRGELGELSDDAREWLSVQSTPETRLGPRCHYFEECFVTRMRREAAQANIVIVNHHLFFADLALKAAWPQAQVLPAYEAAIFDEAHGLEDVATDYFGLQVSSHRLTHLAREIARSGEHGADLAGRVDERARQLFAGLAQKLGGEARVRVADDLWRGDRLADYYTLDNVLDEAAAALELGDDDEAQQLAARAQLIRTELATLVERVDRTYVYWAETRGRGVFLHASPIDVAPLLRERLVSAVPPIVFTSATLQVGGSFDFFCRRLGFAAAEEATCVALRSPFDYAAQARLYVAQDLPDPQEADFIAAATDRMIELVELTRGSAFLLFTSYRNLRAALARLRAAALPYPLLVQGERPRGALLTAFRERPGNVLVATGSFWEGVDVMGDALQLVVIDKLPFAPPDDPVGAARIDLMRERGQDPFRHYQLPRAALMLKQGFGRLIRHRADRGIVAVLDRRMVTRGYGRTFLRSLPPDCPQVADMAELRTWWQSS
jgi:ATP-dependent DNA helicase DinG